MQAWPQRSLRVAVGISCTAYSSLIKLDKTSKWISYALQSADSRIGWLHCNETTNSTNKAYEKKQKPTNQDASFSAIRRGQVGKQAPKLGGEKEKRKKVSQFLELFRTIVKVTWRNSRTVIYMSLNYLIVNSYVKICFKNDTVNE